MRVLGLCGSLRAASSNKAALEALLLLAPEDCEIFLYWGLGLLPHFNPDLDGDALPEPARKWRALVGQCQAMILSCPEYAHGIPGSFKNALDWLVGGVEFAGMPVLMIDTSGRATHAVAALKEVLRTMAARLIREEPILLPLAGRDWDAKAIAADPECSLLLNRALTDLRIEVTSNES